MDLSWCWREFSRWQKNSPHLHWTITHTLWHLLYQPWWDWYIGLVVMELVASFALFVTLSIYHSWHWWFTYIAGIYNDPAGRSLWTIFLMDPGWAYEKPKPHDRKYWKDLQYRLHDIHVWQHESSWQLRHLCMVPVIITIVRHFLLAIICTVGTIELSLTICRYTGRTLAYLLGFLWIPTSSSLPLARSRCKTIFKQNKYSRRKKVQFGITCSRLCSSHAFSTALNIDDMVAQCAPLNFDSDASSIICDNSANVHICNQKSMFVGDILPLHSHTVANLEEQPTQHQA